MYRPAAVHVCWLILVLLATPVRAAAGDDDEFDNAKHKLQLNAWVSTPTGYFNGTNKEGYFLFFPLFRLNAIKQNVEWSEN